MAAEEGSTLIVIPGDDRPDWDLVSHSTVPLAVADRVWRYWLEGERRMWLPVCCCWLGSS